MHEKIITIIEQPEHMMFDLIQSFMGIGETDDENYLYYRHHSPILLVSHIDTVRSAIPVLKVEENIISSKTIMGADDRAGVYAMTEIYSRCVEMELPLPGFLFTNYEETGGRGMIAFLEKFKKNDFHDTKLAIALDRCGQNEYVHYNPLPENVASYIETFGFIKHVGTGSDVFHFTKKTKIPSVNLSVGYYNRHSNEERLHIDELEINISKFMEIIRNPIGKRYAS